MKSNAVSVSGGIWSGLARGKAIAIWLSAGVLSLEKVKLYVTYFLALSARLPSAPPFPEKPRQQGTFTPHPAKGTPECTEVRKLLVFSTIYLFFGVRIERPLLDKTLSALLT